MNFWKWILCLFGVHDECCHRHHKIKTCGDIILGYGLHELKIKVQGTPCKVSVCIKDPVDGCCVCYGDVNKIGFVIHHDGFVLYADIRSNTCMVEWVCESIC